MKALWKVIKNQNSKQKGEQIETNLDANTMNNYFANIGRRINKELKTSQQNFKITENFDSNNEKSCFFFDCIAKEIKRIILSIKSKESTDVYEVNIEILKKLSDEISYPMSVLINKCLREGCFPDELKIAKIIPIYKKKVIKMITITTGQLQFYLAYQKFLKLSSKIK